MIATLLALWSPTFAAADLGASPTNHPAPIVVRPGVPLPAPFMPSLPQSFPRPMDIRGSASDIGTPSDPDQAIKPLTTPPAPPAIGSPLVASPTQSGPIAPSVAGPAGVTFGLQATSQPSYARGQAIAYAVVITNSNATSVPVGAITDQVPMTASVAGSLATSQVSGQALMPCNSSTSPNCSLSNNALNVNAFTLAANTTITITFNAVLIGIDKGCSTVSDVASVAGWGSTNTVSMLVCDTGLGNQRWNVFTHNALGPMADAAVNVANGNLMLRQQLADPVPGHGSLDYSIRLAYNSQDLTNSTPTLYPGFTTPSSFGAGWTLTIGRSLPNSVDEDLSALYIDANHSVNSPMAITVVDASGGRYVYTNAGSFTPISLSPPPPNGPYASLAPHTLTLGPGFNTICVDQTFKSPPGLHLNIWRYVQASSAQMGNCSPASWTSSAVLGFAAIRQDRERFEFAADGRIVDKADGAGNSLRYLYQSNPYKPNALSTVYESGTCSQPPALPCRMVTLAYPNSTEVDITDPGGRIQKVSFDSGAPMSHLLSAQLQADPALVQVTWTYAYSGCPGGANQICTVLDPRRSMSRLTYSPSASGPPSVQSISDRLSTQTQFNYSTSSTLASTAGLQRNFLRIDAIEGSAAQLDEGTGTVLRRTEFTWDFSGPARCRAIDNIVDNNLCEVIHRSLTSTPDGDTQYNYTPEGRLISERRISGPSVIQSTWSYQFLAAVAGNTSYLATSDSVAGSGNVNVQPNPWRTNSVGLLFVVSALNQSLPPNGNAGGSAWANFVSSYRWDAQSVGTVGAVLPAGTTVCPTSPTNTGLLCELDQPAFDGVTPTITRYTYDQNGQVLSMLSPKAVAEGGGSFAYTYYRDADRDLSGLVSAGGWLKAVTDPTGQFVAYGYDRAGHQSQAWDRDGTSALGLSVAAYPAASGFSQRRFASSPSAVPGAYVVSVADALGDTTNFTLDANGNQTALQPPRGTVASSSAYNVLQTFDAVDHLLTRALPLEVATPTRYGYDALEFLASQTDGNGHVVVRQNDVLGRVVGEMWTRGAWPTDGSQPTACRQSVTGDAPIPAGLILCNSTASYDGENNRLAYSDGNHQTTNYSFDGFGREIRHDAPRYSGSFTTLRTDTVYDADGNPTDSCPPREFAPLPDGNSTTCAAGGYFSVHRSFDPLDRQTAQRTFRQVGSPANVVAYTYDADGSRISTTDAKGSITREVYDLLDRRIAEGRPYTANPPTNFLSTGWTHTTNFKYTPSGHEMARFALATDDAGAPLIYTDWRYDLAGRLLDSVAGAVTAASPPVGTPLVSAAGLPDSSGTVNARTRTMYDPDGNVVAQFEPRAFISSTATPDSSFMTRIDYDADGHAIARYTPRYKGPFVAGATQAGYTDEGMSSLQTGQCPTGVAPASVPEPPGVAAIPNFPTDVGVCVSRAQYDAVGNLTRQAYPTSASVAAPTWTWAGIDNRFARFTYSNDNLVAQVETPNPDVTQGTVRVSDLNYYDGVGNRTKTTHPLSLQETWTYTSDNLVSTHTGSPNTSVTPNIAHVTSYSYDANGNRQTETNPVGSVSTVKYYADNLVQDRIDGAGDDTGYTLDNAGNATSVLTGSGTVRDATNPNGLAVVNSYFLDNTLASTTRAVAVDNSIWTRSAYAYSPWGSKVLQETDYGSPTYPSGVVQETKKLLYAPNGRPTQTQANSNAATAISLTYDAAGNRTAITDTVGIASTVSASYYLDGSVRTTDDGLVSTRYGYDGGGSRSARSDVRDSDQLQSTTAYTYIDSGQVASVASDFIQGGDPARLSYDQLGRLGGLSRPHPCTPTCGAPNSTYGYSADGTLLVQSDWDQAGNGTGSYNYAYDAAYRLSSLWLTGGGLAPSYGGTQYKYAYDAANRLSDFQVFNSFALTSDKTLTWDHDSNRLSFGTDTFTYNANDSLNTHLTAGTLVNTYVYSQAMNLQSDGPNAYTYDSMDRLTCVSHTSNCRGGTTIYAYDGLDRQVSHNSGGSTTVHYDGLGRGLASETVSSGTTTRYSLDPAGKHLALYQEAGAAVQSLVDNGAGSAESIADPTGAPLCSQRYDPWGSASAGGGTVPQCNSSITTNGVWYMGQRQDASTGKYQMGFRTYDPSTGTFLTPDATRMAGPSLDLRLGIDPLLVNHYAYVNGDPINRVDSTGHESDYQLCLANVDDPSQCDGVSTDQPIVAPAYADVSADSSGTAAGAAVGALGWFVGNTVDNLQSGDPLRFGLGVVESVAIAAPIAALVAAAVPEGAVSAAGAVLLRGGAAIMGVGGGSAAAEAENGAAAEGAGAEGGALRIFASEGRAAAAERAGALNPGASGKLFATNGQYEFGNIAQSNLSISARGANVAGYWEVPGEYASKFSYVGRVQPTQLWEGGGREFTMGGSIPYDQLGPFRLIPWAAGQ